MEIVERYLQSLAFWLPEEQRADIVAELREDLRSEIEDREAKAHRLLNDADIAALLKRRGNPLVVAERYLPQRFLIGPLLFPVYSLVLKIVVFGYAVPALAVWLCLLMVSPGYWAAHPGIEKLHGLGSVWTVVWWSFIAVTIAFAALERLHHRVGLLERWDPRKLKPVQDLRQVPRSQSGSELATALVFVAWWRGWAHIPEIPGLAVTYGPIWSALYWPIAAVVLASGLLAAFRLIRPAWTRGRAAARLVLDLAAVVLACGLVAFHPWVTVVAPALAPSVSAGIETTINGTLVVTFVFAVVTYVLRAIQDLRRLRGAEPLHHWAVSALAGS